ncbi:MAG: hypothetical protein C5B56_05835 [Proteobacteria bacterium]|nr:MAG: hypothetical protein C5B56_05835 [Pseudomonadota bacterium]
MMARKRKPTAEKPPPHTDETGPDDDRGQQSASEPRRPAEPFEECGPSGGYGGAGTDDEAKDND